MKKETLYLIGGSGFIGKNLVRCLSPFYGITVFDKYIDTQFFSNYPQVQTCRLDLVIDKVPTNYPVPEFIINLASVVTAERDLSLFDILISSNLKILLNLFERFRDDKRLKMFIQFGSSEEYGSENSPFKEENRENPNSPYALVKQLTTNTSIMLHRNYGFPVMVVRPGNLFGPGQNKSKFIPYVIDQLKKGEPLNVSPCKQKRDFIYADDFAKSIHGLLDNSEKCVGEIVNVSSGSSISKPETEERVHTLKIFDFIQSGEFIVKYPEIAVWKIDNATLFYSSDFILTNNQLIWHKFYAYNFTKNYPCDKFLIRRENNILYIRKPYRIINVDVAFTLIGVHSHVWSHALSEYFTKLSQLQLVLDDAKCRVAILVPNYKDDQLKEVIYKEINKYTNVEIIIVNENEAVRTPIAYYVERPCKFTDHEDYVEIGDSVQPKIVSDIIKQNLVNPYLSSLSGLETTPKYKLYLSRKNGKYRNLTNNDEVEQYFKDRGYFIFEPHTVSLEEKIRIFNNAEVIVGPFSSAFSNMIFSKSGTKVLMFTNYNRAFESWLCMHEQYFGMDMLLVTGQDTNTGNLAHCSYYIPLEKIERACKHHGIPV